MTTITLEKSAPQSPTPQSPGYQPPVEAAKARLHEIHGDGERERVERGVDQVARLWREEDGDDAEFLRFVESEFVPSGDTLEATFHRLEYAFERLGGLMTSLIRDLRRGADVDNGPLLPLDELLSAYNPAAHMTEDLYKTKIAFVCLLNFPFSGLEERVTEGAAWSRREWAENRLTEGFSSRVPASVVQAVSAARAASSTYVSSYNLYMHHLLTADGRRLFAEGQRLIAHWGLRDELKASYVDEGGLEKQRLIELVFNRIVNQEIPAAVINDPRFDWTPETNEVTLSPVRDGEDGPAAPAAPSSEREADERYRYLLDNFHAARLADPHHPENPTYLDRSFNLGREMSEERVRNLFEEVLSAPLRLEVGELIEKRLGRSLEPFDIWYVGFTARGSYTEEQLDARVKELYPDVAAFEADVPRLLRDLGFSDDKARFVAERVCVEPARGSGHAYGAARRDDNVLLRTRIPAGGMDYQGYNTALHELGHNVEQIFSTITIDHTLLQGVPNTAFTEAMAFVFQGRDVELLGLGEVDAAAAHMNALDTFWATREIAGVALVDMAVWRWLYENPDATPAELRETMLAKAREVWNEYFADVFGVRDQVLLSVYQHMINRSLYLPDYPMGHIIAFQIERYFETFEGSFGDELERICQLGKLAPDIWMHQAVGSAVSAQPLVEAATAALAAVDVE